MNTKIKKERIQYKRYGLVNKHGVIWEGLVKNTISSLYGVYTGMSGKGQAGAIADGWTVKIITLYFSL